MRRFVVLIDRLYLHYTMNRPVMAIKRNLKNLLADADMLCRTRGGRLTLQRQAVLSELLAAGKPLTAYELLDRLYPKDPAMTPASTYRSLDFLIEMGLIHRLESTRSFVGCECPHHMHAGQFLICRQCGTVVEAEDKHVAQAAQDLGQRYGFTLDCRSVELTGVCGTCQTAEISLSARP